MVGSWLTVSSRVWVALMRRRRTVHEADDLVQEAWVRLTCHEGQKPEAALNLSSSSLWARTCRGEGELLRDAELIDAKPSADALRLSRERMARLSVCVGRLDDESREVLLAHRVKGMSYQEIARQHRLSMSTVERRVAMATLLVTSWIEGW